MFGGLGEYCALGVGDAAAGHVFYYGVSYAGLVAVVDVDLGPVFLEAACVGDGGAVGCVEGYEAVEALDGPVYASAELVLCPGGVVLCLGKEILPDLVAAKHHAVGHIDRMYIAAVVFADAHIDGAGITVPVHAVAAHLYLGLDGSGAPLAAGVHEDLARDGAVLFIVEVYDGEGQVGVGCPFIFLCMRILERFKGEVRKLIFTLMKGKSYI